MWVCVFACVCVNMLVLCTVVGLLILVMLLRVLFPLFWTDVVFLKDLIVMLVRFSWRRRLHPPFLAVDRFLEQAAQYPDKTFVVFGSETFSYDAIHRRSNRMARALLAQSCLRAGDTVALFMHNEPDFLIAWIALAQLGCTTALLNHNIRAGPLLHCIHCSGAKVLITNAGKHTNLTNHYSG